MIYDYLMGIYYGTKINKNELQHQYKLAVIENMDSNNLKELNNKQIRESCMSYRFIIVVLTIFDFSSYLSYSI